MSGRRAKRLAEASPAAAIDALPPTEVPGRLERLREAMDRSGLPGLLVSGRSNVRYLCGFSGSAGYLLVLPGENVLVTDGRYTAQAQGELAGCCAPVAVLTRPTVDQPALLKEQAGGLGRLGLEADHLTWGLWRRWSEGWAADLELVPTTALVEGLRLYKSPSELGRLAAAAAVADAALAEVEEALAEVGEILGEVGESAAGGGRRAQWPSEAELALDLDLAMQRLGAEAPAFDTIVASGANGAEPHHRPGHRRLVPGDLVVVDFGAEVDGYRSDMTRVLVVGGPGQVPTELRRAARVVLAAQDAGLAAVRDGVPAAEVDRACREVVEAAGLGELFVHGTGHGVGLDVHEAPSVARTSEDILTCGQVVTVEPGVYIPGLGGARTEDTVVVTEAGCQVLTMTPKQAQASL